MYNSNKHRINRFLAADGRCLDVAIDHGVFNEFAFLDGLEDMPASCTRSSRLARMPFR